MNIKKILDTFQPAPWIPVTGSEEEIQSRYKYWRMRIFYSIYFGYVFFYFTRKSFTFAMPMMMEDLGFTKADLGILGSVLYISYGVSKFLSGVMSDRSNPRYFMSVGLILTGIANIFFGFSSSLVCFAIFWAMNGIFQGWGWPPCTKQLTYWFSQKERGFWWSLNSTSHNLGGAIIPLLVAYASSLWGWRWSLFLPGMISIVAGFFLLERMRDSPRSLGLPSVEEYKNENNKKVKEESLSAKEILLHQVLNNKAVWILGLSYFFVYVVRTAINDWGTLYLSTYKGYSLIEAAGSIAWFEIGGFLGCIGAGWGSDRFFDGRRIPLSIICTLGLLISLSCFWNLGSNHLWLANALMAAIGFLIFGPQMLVGLAAAEFVDKKAAGTANGFAGCLAYLGAAATGYPLGKIIDIWNWEGFFITLLVCSGLLSIILIPFLGNFGFHKLKETRDMI